MLGGVWEENSSNNSNVTNPFYGLSRNAASNPFSNTANAFNKQQTQQTAEKPWAIAREE